MSQAHHVATFIGSSSDKEHLVNSKMVKVFEAAGIDHHVHVASAHRHPQVLSKLICDELALGTTVFIGAAGMSAALPGSIVSSLMETLECLPVLGVALPSKRYPNGEDAERAIVELPPGVDALYAGFGSDGLTRAAVMACQIIGVGDQDVQQGLARYLSEQASKKPAEPDIDIGHKRNQ